MVVVPVLYTIVVSVFSASRVWTRSISPNDVAELQYESYLDYDRLLHIKRPVQVTSWPEKPLTLGQVTGVSVTPKNKVVIVHRGTTIWDQSSFNSSEHYQHISQGPIKDDIILVLEPETGAVIKKRGGGRFYMPHGITVDKKGNLWLTDVAMHQVLRLPTDTDEPSLIVGQEFQPGSDDKHFCKPTSVAVAESGEFFVADGYCNNRVLRFSPEGKVLSRWGDDTDSIFSLPHGIDLDESREELCVADREHGRVVCVSISEEPETVNMIEAVAPHRTPVYDVKISGDLLYAVTSVNGKGGGFTASADNGQTIDVWGRDLDLSKPHALAVSGDHCIYIAQIGPNSISKYRLVDASDDVRA